MADEDPSARTAKAQHRAQVGSVLLIAVLGLGAFFLFDDSGDDDEPHRVAPSVVCHELVRQQLNNPATADFQASRTTTTSTSIRGVVQAQNDFGVVQELGYDCTVNANSGTVTGASVSQ